MQIRMFFLPSNNQFSFAMISLWNMEPLQMQDSAPTSQAFMYSIYFVPERSLDESSK